jgi:hypothetical protein
MLEALSLVQLDGVDKSPRDDQLFEQGQLLMI